MGGGGGGGGGELMLFTKGVVRLSPLLFIFVEFWVFPSYLLCLRSSRSKYDASLINYWFVFCSFLFVCLFLGFFFYSSTKKLTIYHAVYIVCF